METQNRKYKLPNGNSLSEDLPRIQKGFTQVDKDVTQLHEKIEKGLTDLKEETTSSNKTMLAMIGNLSLMNLERTQKIKVGVEI